MNIVWTEIRWLIPGLIVLAVIAVGLFLSYRRQTGMPVRLRWLAGGLKWLGFALLLLLILRPEIVRTFNRPGTNHWAVLLDNSASMTLQDGNEEASRADTLTELTTPRPGDWQERLGEDFILDTFAFDSRLARQSPGIPLKFDGQASSLGKALSDLRDRYHGRPLAGILVITDGSPTDGEIIQGEIEGIPPIFPLVIAPENKLTDVSLANLTAQATLFEDAPVMIDATVSARGLSGKTVVATIREHGGKPVGEKRHRVVQDEETWVGSFQIRPQAPGTAFFQVSVAIEDGSEIKEATLENNIRTVAANRDTGPYRVLYLGGRPNYEHKFLQRALAEDTEISLTSLIRIARREPKFDYRSRAGEKSNPLYRGFEEQEEAERFDEPVFIRLNAKDSNELATGFPKTAAELFPFDAVILDDVEAEFFDRDQQRLLQRFVSERGGSVAMLGGMESLDSGGYADTTIGDMLPVYLAPGTPAGAPEKGRFFLTREGLLEPWARLRLTEDEERNRLSRMPVFDNVHRLGAIRPGATEVGELRFSDGTAPAIATRRYGRGRSAVFAMTDLWRWGLRDPQSHADLDKTWRQTLRWLLADVPRPLSLKSEIATDTSNLLTAELLGEDFHPDDSGNVRLRVRRPDETWSSVSLRRDVSEPGAFNAKHSSTNPGPYLAEATTRATDTKPALSAATGWVVNSIQDEFQALEPDMATMNLLATTTGGKVLNPSDLDDFVASLENLPLPIQETRSEPLWHSAWWMLAAFLCFIGEWSLRRWKKLP